MKKSSMILALIAALTMVFVFIGCGGNLGETDVTKESSREVVEPEVFLFEIPIVANQYGPDNGANNVDLQAKLYFSQINKELGLELGIPKNGDKLTFDFTVVPDSDVTGVADTDQINVFLLDDDPANGYWNELGQWAEVDGGDISSTKYRLEVGALEEKKSASFGGTMKVKSQKPITSKFEHISITFRIDGRSWGSPVTLKVKSLSVE